MSVNRISLFAFIAKATKAERVSLSPYLSSSFATVSFSFTIGITFKSINFFKVLEALLKDSRELKSALVIKI